MKGVSGNSNGDYSGLGRPKYSCKDKDEEDETGGNKETSFPRWL